MKLFRAQFEFITQNTGRLPGFSGNLVRGFLGEHLWQHDKELYDILFEKKILKQQFPGRSEYPSPFVLYAHYKPGGQFQKGDNFSFVMGFWNDYDQYYPRLINLLMQAPGISLENGLNIHFQGSRNLPSPFTKQPHIRWPDCQNLKTSKKFLTVKLQSPVVLNRQNEITFSDFLQALMARFRYLNSFFGKDGSVEFPVSPGIQISECQWKQVHIPHRHRSGQTYAIQTWTGRWKLAHNQGFEPLFPLLVFGQYMQVGHRTSAGFGKYRLI